MAGPDSIITLDANSDDSKRKIARTGVKNSEFVRCNFCVEPGWLSINDDPKKHRQLVHSSVLFYCDTCEDGEPGAKGFETFKEISKHVVKENGIDPTDTVNICELIRIPSKPDSLKLFRCTFCPGDGFKFVGLSEDTLVKHVQNRHGEKALRSRPDKLERECRVCGREYNTDHELTNHITRRHLVRGKENRFLFGGFGPRIKKGRKDSGDDEIGRGRVSRSESVDERPSGRRKTSTPINAYVYGERNSAGRKGVSSGREPDIVTLEKLPRFEKKKFMRRDERSRSSSVDDKRQIFGRKIATKIQQWWNTPFSSVDERKQSKRKKMTSDSSDDKKRFKIKKTAEKRKRPSSSSSGDESERSERKRAKRSSSSSSNGSQDKMTKNRMEVSWSENDIRWLELTDQFLNKISKKKSSGQNKHGNSTKSSLCDFCGKSGIQDMPKHLSEIHQDKTFLCSLCEKQFADIDAAGDHLKHEHNRNVDVKSQVKTGLLQPPPCLLSVLCQFCSPPQRVVPSSSNTANFMYEIYEHMEEHEDQHRGIEEKIELATVYSCRICTGRVWKDLPSLIDHVNKSHKKVEGRAGQALRSNESKDWEDRNGKKNWKRVGKVQDGPSHRYSHGGEMKSPHSHRQDNSAKKVGQATAGRVHALQDESSRHRDVKYLSQSKTRAQYKSYPTKSSFQLTRHTENHSRENNCSKKVVDAGVKREGGKMEEKQKTVNTPVRSDRGRTERHGERDKLMRNEDKSGPSNNTNHPRKINCSKIVDDTGVKREREKMEESQKTVNTPVRSDRGRTERQGERDKLMKNFKEDKSRPSTNPSPMEEHRQMIEKLMQMQFIVAGLVQDLVANSVETGEFNLEKYKTIKSKKLEEVGLSSFSEPPNPQPPRLESPCPVTSTISLSHSLSLSHTSNSSPSSPRPHCSTPTSSICEESSPFRPSPVKVDRNCVIVDTDPEIKSFIEEEEDNTSDGIVDTETNALETENFSVVDLSEVAEINKSPDASHVYLEESLYATDGSLDGQIIETMEQLESLLSSGADFKLILAPELIETEAFKIFSMNNNLGLNADCSNSTEEEKGDVRTDNTDDIVDKDYLDKAQVDCDD